MLHDQMGMNGHITVLASGTSPGMPTTGAPNSLPLLAGGLVALLVAARRPRPPAAGRRR